MQDKQLISESAEIAMSQLLDDGSLTNTFSVLNLTVLKERFKCSDVFPMVEASLVRDQDKYNEKRADLAQEIATTLSTTLSEDFSGNAANSKLLLLVRITVVSDGSRNFTRLAGLAGTGMAKVTISYCLFSRKSGKVAVAKQFSQSESARQSDGVPEIFKTASCLRWRLSREIKFTLCSRVAEWPIIAENLVSDSEDESLELSCPLSCGEQTQVTSEKNRPDLIRSTGGARKLAV